MACTPVKCACRALITYRALILAAHTREVRVDITAQDSQPFPMSTRNQNDTLNDTLCVAWKPKGPSFQRPLETQVAARHIKTSHSPCRRSIPQALCETHIRGVIAFWRNPLLHAGSMRFHKHPFETRKSYHGTSKPAIPHVDTGFREHPLEKLSGIAANSKSKPAIRLVDAGLRRHQFETQVASQHIQAAGTWGWDDFAPAQPT